MAVPKIYKSSDGNAPVLVGQKTTMVAILKACLVDGYGDKTPAGWTMPFINVEQTNAVFRNSPTNGTGFYLKVVGDNHPQTPNFYAYEEMTSIDNGLFNFGSVTQSYLYLAGSSSTTPQTNQKSWVLFATDTWFLFIAYGYSSSATDMPISVGDVNSKGAYASPTIFFGDFEKYYQDDGFNCMLAYTVGSVSSSYYMSSSFGCTVSAHDGTNSYFRFARGISGASGGTNGKMCISPPGSAYVSGMGSSEDSIPYSELTGEIFSKIAIYSDKIEFRGYLEHCLGPCTTHPYNNLQQVTIGEETYIYVMWRCSYAASRTPAGMLVRIG